MLSRREFLKWLVSTAGASMLASCTPKGTSIPIPTEVKPTELPKITSVIPKAASGAFSGQINFAIMAGPEADAHIRLAPKFKEATGNTLEVRVEDIGRDVWRTKFITNFQSKSPDWDALSVHYSQFLLAGPGGFLRPLDDYLNNAELVNKEMFDLEDWPKALLDLFRLDGKLYELPQEASALMVFYRKDLVEKWGLEPPGDQGYSWETLTENCRKAQNKIKEENLADTYPLIYGVKGEMAAITFQQIAWSFGADLFVEGKVPNFNTPESRAAMELTLQWAKEGLVSPGFVEYEYPEVLTGFQEGKAVFALQWNAAAADILNPEKSPITANNTAFSVSPYQKDKGPQQLRVWPSVWALGLSSFSKKPEEALSYIVWFTSKEIARDYVTKGGGSSGRRSLLSDPEVTRTNPQYPAMLESFKVYAAFPNLQSYPYIDASILPPHMEAIWQGTESIENALQKATEETKKYLEEQGEL